MNHCNNDLILKQDSQNVQDRPDEVLMDELQRRIRLAEHRAELRRMGQQDLPFYPEDIKEIKGAA
jgi:hypothetical protein